MTELANLEILKDKEIPLIVLMKTDGGPGHNVTFVRVQMALIALFLHHDLDMLVAVRTAPGHSYRNPAECVNAIINLGLQSIGVMRQKLGTDALEKAVCKCNNLVQFRTAVESKPQLDDELEEAIQPAKDLLDSVIGRLFLKENKFHVFQPASEDQVQSLFEEILAIDHTVTMKDTKKMKRPGLQKFLDHCCRMRTYSFTIKKCGKSDCDICKPLRYPDLNLSFLPDLIPDPTSEHYKPFTELYGHPDKEDGSEQWGHLRVLRKSTQM